MIKIWQVVLVLLLINGCGEGARDSYPVSERAKPSGINALSSLSSAKVVPTTIAPQSVGSFDGVVFPEDVHPSLNSENTAWDPDLKTLIITRDVEFTKISGANLDEDKDGFYWDIPASIKKVVIGKGVRVTGHFRFTSEQILTGEDRDTSVIYGTLTKAWARGPNGIQDEGTACGNPGAVAGDDRVHDCEKWRYGAISVVPTADKALTYRISNLTVENPRTYAITAIDHRLVVDRVIIKNTRPAPDSQSNSDGFGGGRGSMITNSKIDTWDDAIKLYKDGMTVRNVTIVHNQNGAPFQLGWGNKAPSVHNIHNVKVVQAPGTDNAKFNSALFTNSGGNVFPEVNISGLSAEYSLSATVNNQGVSKPIPLFYIKGAGSQIKINSMMDGKYSSNIGLRAPSAVLGSGIIKVNLSGETEIKSSYIIGSPSLVTGCSDCP